MKIIKINIVVKVSNNLANRVRGLSRGRGDNKDGEGDTERTNKQKSM